MCSRNAFLVKPRARDGVCEFGASAFCTDVAMATIYLFPLREREKASRTHGFCYDRALFLDRQGEKAIASAQQVL